MLGGNIGSLLYRDVFLINLVLCHAVAHMYFRRVMSSKTSSPKGNNPSTENKQVFSNSSQVRFFQLVKGSQLCSPWLDKILTSTRVVTLLQICKKMTLYNPNVDLFKDNVL